MDFIYRMSYHIKLYLSLTGADKVLPVYPNTVDTNLYTLVQEVKYQGAYYMKMQVKLYYTVIEYC